MAQQKQGWLSRLYEGREKSEDYARNSLPTNRWSLFWDIFKGNFGKIVKINLLMLIFFLPTSDLRARWCSTQHSFARYSEREYRLQSPRYSNG